MANSHFTQACQPRQEGNVKSTAQFINVQHWNEWKPTRHLRLYFNLNPKSRWTKAELVQFINRRVHEELLQANGGSHPLNTGLKYWMEKQVNWASLPSPQWQVPSGWVKLQGTLWGREWGLLRAEADLNSSGMKFLFKTTPITAVATSSTSTPSLSPLFSLKSLTSSQSTTDRYLRPPEYNECVL